MKLSYLANLLEDVNLQLCNPNGETLCIINDCYTADLQLTFNNIDELSISVPKVKNGKDVFYYDWLVLNRVIKIDNVGQFVIQDINTDTSTGEEIKSITAQSLECVLSWKNVPLLKGTYKFFSDVASEIPNTLIGKLKGYMSSWTFDEIDNELYDIYRTFNRENISIYNLIVEDIQPTYECVFKFDTINKSVKIKKVSNLIPKTDVYFSDENLIKDINCVLSKDNFVTVLEVKGSGDLGINRVNPIGTNYLYNLDHYLADNTGMMSDGLKTAWTKWKTDYNTYATTYGTKLNTLKTKKDELLALQNEIAVLNADLEVIKDAIDIKNELGQNASSEVSQRRTKENAILTKKNQITAKENETTTINNELDSINATINPIGNTIYFTISQLNELDFLFRTGSCVNDLFAIGNTMTEKQKQEIAESLMAFGKSKLDKLGKPHWTFNLNTINLLANEKYQYQYNQLELPCEVTIEKSEGELFNPILLGCKINLKNTTDMQLTFSESMRVTNDLVTIEDLLGSPAKTQITVIKNMADWINYVDSGDKNRINNWLGNPLQADIQMVTNADNQTFVIDKRGALFRKILANSTDYDEKQLKIINNGIWMTDDNWVTAKLGIGEFTLPNGTKVTGVIGDYIVGNIIMSNNLYITNTAGTVSIDKDGMNVTSMSMTLTNATATNRIILNGTDVIRVQKKVSNTWNDLLYINNDGELKLATYSTTADMNSAITISANGLQSQITATNGNVSTLTQTVNGLSSTVSSQGGSISTLQQTASSLQSQITATNGNVSTVAQTANNLSIAINNTKVVINSTDGITITNGGLKIMNGNTVNFKITTDGQMYLRSNLCSGRIAILDNKIWFNASMSNDGTISTNGGQIYQYLDTFYISVTQSSMPIIIGNDNYYYKCIPTFSSSTHVHDFYGKVRIQTSLNLIGRNCSWVLENGKYYLQGV